MKNFLILFLILPFICFAQDAEPNLYEVVYLTVIDGQEDAFEAAVKKHNEQFHGEGLYSAGLQYNINGPVGGQYSWVMGPTSYTAMDSRPDNDAHNDDWKVVNEFVESTSTPSYWTLDMDLSQRIANPANTKSLVWMYDIKSGQRARFAELVGKVKEVYEKKRPTESFIVVWNEFSDTNAGRDAAVIFNFDKWAWMDRESTFNKQFEEVNGPGSWHHFLNAFNEAVDGRVDWIRSAVD